MSNNLASETAKSALDKVKTLLKDRVPIGLVEQVFVWVVQNETDAKELVTILQDNGFKNIKSDAKGTTITAQSGGGVNATTDSSDSCTAGCEITASVAVYACNDLDSAYSTSSSLCPTTYVPYFSTTGTCDTTPTCGIVCEWNDATESCQQNPNCSCSTSCSASCSS